MADEIDWSNPEAVLASYGEGNLDAKLKARNKAVDDERMGYGPEAGTAYLKTEGFSPTGRQRGTDEVARAAKRAVIDAAGMYKPFYGLQFNANPGALKGLADYFHELGADLHLLREKVHEIAQEDIDQAARVAMEMVEKDRKRKGWAERALYPDRHGKHHLQNAIWESRVVREAGNGFEFVGFDYQVLNDLTVPGSKGGIGYWKEYEFGSRGGFIMPRGIWVGPEVEGGGRKHIKKLASGGQNDLSLPTGQSVSSSHGMDRFYPRRNGRANIESSGTSWSKSHGRPGTAGVYAHQVANPVLKPAIEALASKIGFQLGHVFKEYLEGFHEEGGEGYSVYSKTATMEDLNRL